MEPNRRLVLLVAGLLPPIASASYVGWQLRPAGDPGRWAAAANEVCADVRQDLAQLEAGLGDDPQAAGANAVERLRAAADDLAGLDAPPGLEDEVGRFVALLRVVSEAAEQVLRAVEDGDLARAERIAAEHAADEQELSAHARALGASRCAELAPR
jgi:hypothetical protein